MEKNHWGTKNTTVKVILGLRLLSAFVMIILVLALAGCPKKPRCINLKAKELQRKAALCEENDPWSIEENCAPVAPACSKWICRDGGCEYKPIGEPDCPCFEGKSRVAEAPCKSGEEVCIEVDGKSHWECCPPDCRPGETKCLDGTNRLTCVLPIRHWRTEPCDPGELCYLGECFKPDCKLYEKRCLENDKTVLEVCINGRWTQTDCPTGTQCQEGECKQTIPICQPGNRRCLDAKTAQVCQNGTWRNISCGTNQQCKGGDCVTSVPGSCDPPCSTGQICCPDGYCIGPGDRCK